MVTDILFRVDETEMRAFMDKWGVTPENEFQFTSMQRRQMELENPLSFHFRSALNVNGMRLQTSRGCGIVYVPFRDADDREEWMPILDYYNLDRTSCWVIQRSCYPWKDGQITDIAAMEVTMTHQPMFQPGASFETKVAGESHTFHNPITGVTHTFTIHEYEKQELACDFPGLKDREYPKHHIAMTFSLEPELSQKEFSITDSQQSDEPRVIPNRTSGHKSSGADAIGIIGGADGPTAIIMGTPKSKGQLHAAVSRLCFEPFNCIRWQLSFREKQIEEKTIDLLQS